MTELCRRFHRNRNDVCRRSSSVTSTPRHRMFRARGHRFGLHHRLDAGRGSLHDGCCTRSSAAKHTLRATLARSAPRSRRARPTWRGPARRRSTSSTSGRSGTIWRLRLPLHATPCSARSAARCASPGDAPRRGAGSPSACSSWSRLTRGKIHLHGVASPSGVWQNRLWDRRARRTSWRPRSSSDDMAAIAGGQGRTLYAVDPEFGSTSPRHQRVRPVRRPSRRSTSKLSVCANVATHDDGDMWSGRPAPTRRPTSPTGTATPRPPTAGRGEDHRHTLHQRRCRCSPWYRRTPTACPIDAILFGGRRRTTIHSSTIASAAAPSSARRFPRDHRCRHRAIDVVDATMAMCCLIGCHAANSTTGSDRAKIPDACKLPRIFGIQPNWSVATRTATSCGPASATTAACSSGSSTASESSGRGVRSADDLRATADGIDIKGLRHDARDRGQGRGGSTRGTRPRVGGGAAPGRMIAAFGEQLPPSWPPRLDTLKARLGAKRRGVVCRRWQAARDDVMQARHLSRCQGLPLVPGHTARSRRWMRTRSVLETLSVYMGDEQLAPLHRDIEADRMDRATGPTARRSRIASRSPDPLRVPMTIHPSSASRSSPTCNATYHPLAAAVSIIMFTAPSRHAPHPLRDGLKGFIVTYTDRLISVSSRRHRHHRRHHARARRAHVRTHGVWISGGCSASGWSCGSACRWLHKGKAAATRVPHRSRCPA